VKKNSSVIGREVPGGMLRVVPAASASPWDGLETGFMNVGKRQMLVIKPAEKGRLGHDVLGDRSRGKDWGQNAHVLDDFLRLDRADPASKKDESDVLAFARTWGLLYFCDHRKPYTHWIKERLTPPCVPHVDPVEDWRSFAHEAKSIISAARRLANDDPPDHEEAAAIDLGHYERQRKASNSADIDAQIRTERIGRIADVLDKWVSYSSLVINPLFEGFGVALDFDHQGLLFNLLTAQLMMAVASAPALELCSNCGRLFRGRKRKPGTRRYCPNQECQRAANTYWHKISRSNRRRG
jgi:hypothetical protein